MRLRLVTIPACLVQDIVNNNYKMIDTSFNYDCDIVISEYIPRPIYYPANESPPADWSDKNVKSRFNIAGIGWYVSTMSREEIMEQIHLAATGDAT